MIAAEDRKVPITTASVLNRRRQAMTITGERIYGDNSYTATQMIEMDGRGTMTMKSTGKRLGDCEK